METEIKKRKQRKDEFLSAIKEIYRNSGRNSIAYQRQALVDFYSQTTADEAVLCDRYRKIKYDAEYSLPVILGMYLGGFASIFVTFVIRFFDELELFGGLFLTLVFGLLFTAFGCVFMWKIKRVYMKNKTLFLYPLEMKLLEDELSRDADIAANTIIPKALPDDPDAKT